MSACTGIAASWCPVHGNCSCPRIETGERESEDARCPLHGLLSDHAELVPAYSNDAREP